MGKLIYVLDESIKLLSINAHQLAKHSQVRHSTIYDILHNKAERPPRSTLEKIINSLNAISDEKGIDLEFDINDIYRYIK